MEPRQYILTERAHLMCPNMHFGIKATFPMRCDFERIAAAMAGLTRVHPFLHSVIAADDATGRLYYKICEDLRIPLLQKDDAGRWAEDYQALTKDGWDVFHEPLLKVVVYPLDGGFAALFIAHHLLADGRGLLGLVRQFADCCQTGAQPTYAGETLISSIRDLPRGSDLSPVNRFLIHRANRSWQKEQHAVDYPRYRAFEQRFLRENPVRMTTETMDADAVDGLLERCREWGVSLNDYLVADMMCRERTNRVVIAMDIREKLPCYRTGALGNYATAAGIEVKSSFSDVWATAQAVAAQVERKRNDVRGQMLILACYLRMEPELIDAAAIAAMGGFQSRAGRFVGSLILGYAKRSGYSITNLGNLDDPKITEAVFIPPASPANRKTVGVLSVNRRMSQCTVCYL
jgi:NRPS condensation-like uncharacterized protein